jgi:phosphoheptose isomerase
MKGMCGRRRLPAEVASRLSEVLPSELADHLAANLEPALPTISLSGASSLILAVSNDTDPDMVFAQQVYGYGRPGDVLWAISTSGRSRNVILAAAMARASQMSVVALTGEGAGPLGKLADVCIAVPSGTTAEAQELHRPVYHALCEALESSLAPID